MSSSASSFTSVSLLVDPKERFEAMAEVVAALNALTTDKSNVNALLSVAPPSADRDSTTNAEQPTDHVQHPRVDDTTSRKTDSGQRKPTMSPAICWLAAATLLAGIIIVVRTPDGSDVRIRVPDGSSIRVADGADESVAPAVNARPSVESLLEDGFFRAGPVDSVLPGLISARFSWWRRYRAVMVARRTPGPGP